MTVVALVRDLLIGSRIEEAAARAGRPLVRIAGLERLPRAEEVALLLVAWDERDPGWGPRLAAWRAGGPAGLRLVLFGPHTDQVAHAEARRHGLGPMWARSRLLRELPRLLA